jgi:hypothetical protein
MFRITKRHSIGYAVVFLLYAVVLRNLPWPPFHWFHIPDLTT